MHQLFCSFLFQPRFYNRGKALLTETIVNRKINIGYFFVSQQSDEPMGQLTSKRNPLARNSPSSNEEGPPRYSSHHLDGHNHQDFSAADHRAAMMELRRASVYSTMDQLPQLQNYANSAPRQKTKNRPSLETLRNVFEIKEVEDTTNPGDMQETDIESEESQAPKKKTPPRFGWVIGVTIRCMVNIWGVLMFLRLTWITSQAGVVLTLVIIAMSVTMTTITALSISAIATNGRVISGGTYFLISRTLGPELGGPIGVIFSLANAVASSLNIVGFAELVHNLMTEHNVVFIDKANDIRVIGVISFTLLLFIILAGLEWEMKTQIFFFSALCIAVASYFIGTFIPASVEKQALGVFGYRGDILAENLVPSWRGSQGNFFQMFSIFFPAVTGILAGANISGDLKDPNTAIPKGTLMSILFTTAGYVMIVVTSGACVLRDASGNVSDIITGNNTDGCVGLACSLGWNFTHCSQSQTCLNGLANTSQVLAQVSAVFHLITVGVIACSLSSALAHLVSATKVFQGLCKDNIYPFIMFFGKGYGKNNEAVRGYILFYLIAVAFILIAQLNSIAPLIANFYLCSYSIVNFTCFHASITNSPGWRPRFKYYYKWSSLFGAVVCALLTFLFTWWAALVTWSIVLFLYGYVVYAKPKVNWGSSIQAVTYNMALSYSASLTSVDDHVKNFRPQCLVMTGPPNRRPALVDFVATFTKHVSLMICGDILMEDSNTQPKEATDTLVNWLNKRKVRSFYTPFTSSSLREGTRHLLQATGLGKLKPNTLVLGFKFNWRESTPESIEDYTNTIYDTFDSNFCLCILRMMDGQDIDNELETEENLGFEPDESEENPEETKEEENAADDASDGGNSDQMRTVFQNRQGMKTIDVYWIADDGGLTLLVPYLFTRRRRWRRCKVRVFITVGEGSMKESRDDIIFLLKRFRLEVHDVIVMTDIDKHPHPKSLSRFEENVAPFRLFDEQQVGVSIQELRQAFPWKISDKEFEAFKPKSESKVRLNEIIRRNSQHTALVLVSLPVPQNDCPSALYMAWLDTLTCGLHCPAVLIRGNQENVLTFYCQ
uniref:Solute carrier family 12 member 10, tandem duplicate 1 n=3 Tax=Nothobranchius furzeri TaxID=105023 RepID=A0A8C6VT88_NOTFU